MGYLSEQSRQKVTPDSACHKVLLLREHKIGVTGFQQNYLQSRWQATVYRPHIQDQTQQLYISLNVESQHERTPCKVDLRQPMPAPGQNAF
jgi:hypothetical protein